MNYCTKVFSLILVSTCFFVANNTSAEVISKCDTDNCISYFEKYKKAVKRGHPLAMLTLAQFYHHGYGTKVNEKLALKYFKKAARHGYTSAQFKAGYIYMTSESLQDLDESVDYLEKAAKYDYEGASFLLGMMHFDKKYGRRNIAAADAYFAKSYENKYEQMPTVIKYIEAEMPIDSAAFPKLHAQLNGNPLQKHEDGTLSWHKDNVEVITITSAPLETKFNQQLVDFRKAIKSTGTRFQGKTCTERLTCMQRADIADATDFHHLFLEGFSGKDISQ